jgi:novel protein kinase C epsilon type
MYKNVHDKLLQRDPHLRLGSGAEDAQEIKRHPFFHDIDWDVVANKYEAFT